MADFWGGTDANSTALRNLYGGAGKTGSMIDQPGWDYWSGLQKQGQDITPAFQAATKDVYSQLDTDAGRANPYYAQNRAGFNVLDRANAPGFAAVQAMNAQQAPQSQPAPEQGPAYQSGGQQSYSFTMPQSAPVSSAGLNSYSQNPYLKDMGQGLQQQFNDNLTRNTLPALRGGASMAGQYGGSRQGIAEGLAAAGSNTGAANAITSMYGQDYGQQMSRNLQQYQGDPQFALGNRGADLGFMNSDRNYSLGQGAQALQGQNQAMNFYSTQRGQDQSGAALGASLYDRGINGPWNPISNANGILAPYAGNGTTTTNSGSGGTNWQQVAAGLGGGAQFGKSMGWWG